MDGWKRVLSERPLGNLVQPPTGDAALSTERATPTETVNEGIHAFQEAFPGSEPSHLSRAPGRVNLIGEHTDYNGLPVFPMAM